MLLSEAVRLIFTLSVSLSFLSFSLSTHSGNTLLSSSLHKPSSLLPFANFLDKLTRVLLPAQVVRLKMTVFVRIPLYSFTIGFLWLRLLWYLPPCYARCGTDLGPAAIVLCRLWY